MGEDSRKSSDQNYHSNEQNDDDEYRLIYSLILSRRKKKLMSNLKLVLIQKVQVLYPTLRSLQAKNKRELVNLIVARDPYPERPHNTTITTTNR
jgi:hypothetical protein